MDALERDYASVLLADHAPPCLSLYQPTHRHFPDRRQDPIRFRNLVDRLEASLQHKYDARDAAALIGPFRRLADERLFWGHVLDGLAVLASSNLFKVYRLQRPVPEIAVAADSFHTKPLLRILQSADRYQILGLSQREMRLFEGNRDAIDEIEPAAGVPRTLAEVVTKDSGPERSTRVVSGAAPGGTRRHGTDVREDALAAETERFYRALDEAVLEQYSRPTGMPLLLAALPANQHAFRAVSRNPFLAPEAIDTYPDAMSLDALRERAWQLILPRYLERLNGFIERFRAARGTGLATDDLDEIAAATAAGRIAVLLIEADRHVAGVFDAQAGQVRPGDLEHPEIDDLLDDLGEHALRSGAEVVVVPRERMPTDAGIAAILRF